MNKDDKFLTDLQKKQDKALEKELIQNYQRSLKEVKLKIADVYEKYETDGTLSMMEMNKYNRLLHLEKQIADILKDLEKKNYKLSKNKMVDNYIENHLASDFLISQHTGNPFTYTIDRNKIQQSLNNPVNGLLFDETHQKQANDFLHGLRQELTQSLIQGETYRQAAKRIQNRFDMAGNRALKIARTENTKLNTLSRLDSYQSAKDRGLIDKLRWVSGYDMRVRSNHAYLNNKTTDEEGFFHSRNGKTKGPGLFGKASEDINCRCTITPYFEETEEEKAKFNEYQEMFKNMTFDEYQEWVKERNKGKKPISELVKERKEKEPEKVNEVKTPKFKKAKDINEANDWAKKHLPVNHVDFKRLDIDYVNDINEQLYHLNRLIPEVKYNNLGSSTFINKRMKEVGYSTGNLKGVNAFQFSDDTEIGNGIGFNTTYGKDYNIIKKNLLDSEKIGFSPKGIKDPKYIVSHEYGHMLDDYLRDKDKEFSNEVMEIYRKHKPDISNEVSKYASYNNSEFFAESFASYIHKEEVDKVSDEVGKLIEKKLKRKLR